MKRKITVTLIAVMLMQLTSCKKFLEETSNDLITPVTITQFKELLQGEGYYHDIFDKSWFAMVMTDDVSSIKFNTSFSGIDRQHRYAGYAFKWGADLEASDGSFTDGLFQYLYKNIFVANNCLIEADKATGTAEERKVLKGQAHFLRAYGYFYLANLYAQAYNEAKPTDLCVPMNLEASPTLRRYNRATIREVWDLIKSDIEQAVKLLADDKVSRRVFEVNYKAALLLASRIFLYMEDYESAILYGERFLALHPALYNITGVTRWPIHLFPFPGPEGSYFTIAKNPEIVFTLGKNELFGTSYESIMASPPNEAYMTFSISKDVPRALLGLYTPSDNRFIYWFARPTSGYPAWKPMKVSLFEKIATKEFFHSSEVYLTLAEAYARKANPDNTRALNLLNQLRNNRIKSNTELNVTDFPDQPSFIRFIWEERRRELCFEELHRWWDLKRTGQPALEHAYLGKNYRLNAKDPAYLLNFPKQEFQYNPALIPNFRPVRDPL